MIRFTYSRDVDFQIQGLTDREYGSFQRLKDMIRKYPGLGRYLLTDRRGRDWLAMFGHDIYVAYRWEGSSMIRIGWIGYWEPGEGFYDKP